MNMIKKWICSICIVSLFAGIMTGCGKTADTTTATQSNAQATETTNDNGTYQVALVMDIGILNDKSYNQGTWEGLQEYCDENNLTYKYYKSEEKSTEKIVLAIDEAINSGAEVVVCPGYLFESAIFSAQKEFPDVKFILLDGEPHNEDYSVYETTDNTMPILYREEQAGFLAGYAAVKDGNTSLGFMGGIALPAVMRYGYGYLLGAEYAAKEDGLNSIQVKYTYTGNFDETPEAESMADNWYANGTQIVFACGGLVGNSVMQAAEDTDNCKVIGVDVDQYSESITVVTSAMKMLSNSVKAALGTVYDGTFKGGETAHFDITNGGVGIAMDTARFTSFTKEQYDNVYNKLLSGEIKVDVDTDKPISGLSIEHLQVEEVEF